MFDKPYKFVPIGQTIKNPFIGAANLLHTLHYSFSTEHNHYLVDIKCYTNSLYIIEFFLRADKNSKKHSKYGKLTNERKSSRIIRTCFDIMLHILSKDKKASFAFIGSPTYINHSQSEPIEATKRFSIYRYVAINLLGKNSFVPFDDEKTSCFLAANKLSNINLIKQEANIVLKSLF